MVKPIKSKSYNVSLPKQAISRLGRFKKLSAVRGEIGRWDRTLTGSVRDFIKSDEGLAHLATTPRAVFALAASFSRVSGEAIDPQLSKIIRCSRLALDTEPERFQEAMEIDDEPLQQLIINDCMSRMESEIYLQNQLIEACLANDRNRVEALLQYRFDININPKGEEDDAEPVYLAAANNLEDILRLLLEAGASIDQQKVGLLDPLDVAAEKGHEGVVRLLLNSGAKVDMDWKDYTPLHRAVEHGHEGVVRLLLNSGAKVDIDGKNGTPLHRAVEHGHEGVARLLLNSGAKVDCIWEDHTPLQCSQKKGNVDMAVLLIENGAAIEDLGFTRKHTEFLAALSEKLSDRDLRETLKWMALEKCCMRIKDGHMSRVLRASSRDNSNIKLSELKTMYSAINFDDSEKEGYIDPSKLTSKRGYRVSKHELLSKLNSFLINVAEASPGGLHLKNIIYALKQESDPTSRALKVLELARELDDCSAGQLATVRLLDQQFNHQVEQGSVQALVDAMLLDFRRNIIYGHSNGSPHRYNGFVEGIGIYLGLSNNRQSQSWNQEMFELFFKSYQPSDIISHIAANLNIFPGDLLVDWMKEKLVPAAWKQKEYSRISKDLNAAKTQKALERAAAKHSIAVQPYAQYKGKNYKAYVLRMAENERRVLYLNELYCMETGKLKRSTVILILEKLDVLERY